VLGKTQHGGKNGGKVEREARVLPLGKGGEIQKNVQEKRVSFRLTAKNSGKEVKTKKAMHKTLG